MGLSLWDREQGRKGAWGGGVKGKRPAQGVWPCGPTASPTPNGSTLGRGGSGQRELPSVKQAGGAGHPPNLRSSSGSRGPQETAGGPQCITWGSMCPQPCLHIPSSLGVFTIPARSSHCLFPCGRPSGTRTPQIIASGDQPVATSPPSPGLVQSVISNFKCTKKQGNVTHSQE